MFNRTSDIIITGDISDIRQAFIESVEFAGRLHREWHVQAPKMHRYPPLPKLMEERIDNISQMEICDVVNIYKIFGSVSEKSRLGSLVARKALMIYDKISDVDSCNRWLKVVFVNLWSKGLLQFPLSFKFGSSFTEEQYRKFLPSIVSCQLVGKSYRNISLGMRIVLASPWRSYADVNLNEFAYLVRDACKPGELLYLMGYTDGQARNLPTAFYTCLSRICRAGAGAGFPYTENQISKIRYWIRYDRDGRADSDPLTFIDRWEDTKRRNIVKGKRDYSVRHYAAQSEFLRSRRSNIRSNVLDDLQSGATTPKKAKMQIIADDVSDGNKDIYEYFRALRRSRTGLAETPYPSRMAYFDSIYWSRWNRYFSEFIDHRRQRGFESESLQEHIRICMRDYLCCYLPWWSEMKSTLVDLPEDPSRFKRFGHWIELGDQGILRPDPLLVFYGKSTLGDAKGLNNTFVKAIHSFFEFCRAHSRRLGLTDATFENPVVSEIDRISSRSSRSKTNKTPIRRELLPWLLRYGYAVENHFDELSRRILSGELTIGASKFAGILLDVKPAEVRPAIEFDGRQFELEAIPNVAVWRSRAFIVDGRAVHRIVPAISGLRMCLVALETGLRFQGIQWLCRKLYRSLLEYNSVGDQLVPLVVNTDKVKDRPFKTLIVNRAMDVLGLVDKA